MKARLFETHYIRKEIPITPAWDFWTLNLDGEKDRKYNMIVPSCWESNPSLASYKGQGIYSKTIDFGGNVRLVFKGISHTAHIFIDGVQVAYHYNAYTEFHVLLKNIPNGKHLIEVKADNTFHEESSLHVPNDYYSYGGITRPVIIEQLEDAYIKKLHFTPYIKDGTWFAKIESIITNLSDKTLKADVSFSLNNDSIGSLSVELSPNTDAVIEECYLFDDVMPYTLNSPKLYKLKAQLTIDGNTADDLIERVGFREVKIDGEDILFNNEKIIIKGVNRHEDYAEFGCAIPVEAMYRDIEIIKSLGANCVRTCHYPNDERFLDMCDEKGILVWEEAHARGLSEDQMKHKNFNKQSADCINEMIGNHYNHPSIFVWGVLNECVSNTDFGRSIFKLQIDQIRKLDKSRPVTYASLQAFIGNDKCLDLVDIVSYNIYPRWYENIGSAELVKSLKDFVSGSEGSGKPLLISEIGAGGIYGHRSHNCEKWSEEFQEMLLKEQLTTILEDEQLSGVIVWQYADCRVDLGWFGVRPKCQNNKGLVDVYRRKKLAFNKVKEIFENTKL